MSAVLKVVEKEGMENKNKALDAALAQIERAFGKGSIMKLGQREAMEIESISTGSLGLGHRVQGQRGLARRLRPVDLGDAASRQAPDPQRHVERDGPGGDDGDLLERAARAKAHDRPLAELPLDLRDRQL